MWWCDTVCVFAVWAVAWRRVGLYSFLKRRVLTYYTLTSLLT